MTFLDALIAFLIYFAGTTLLVVACAWLADRHYRREQRRRWRDSRKIRELVDTDWPRSDPGPDYPYPRPR